MSSRDDDGPNGFDDFCKNEAQRKPIFRFGTRNQASGITVLRSSKSKCRECPGGPVPAFGDEIRFFFSAQHLSMSQSCNGAVQITHKTMHKRHLCHVRSLFFSASNDVNKRFRTDVESFMQHCLCSSFYVDFILFLYTTHIYRTIIISQDI